MGGQSINDLCYTKAMLLKEEWVLLQTGKHWNSSRRIADSASKATIE